MIKVLLVDDHTMFREGLKKLILEDPEIEFVEEADNGLAAAIKAGVYDPDVVIMDYDMPIYNGIYGTKEILKQFPTMPVMLLSMFNDKEHIFEAINAGVRCYLNKMAKSQEMIQAVKALYNGGTWFKGEIAEKISSYVVDNVNGQNKHREKEALTQRQKQIVSLFADGHTATEISKILSLSIQTIQVHKSNIYKKLYIHNNTELVRYAIRNNLTKVT
ncbi:MAG: response regulator transcription factor [Bacteroidota bacterium]